MTKHWIVGGCLLACAAMPAVAQVPPPDQGYGAPADARPEGGWRGSRPPLTRERALAMADRGFAMLDTDRDGTVTRAEFAAFRDARRAARDARRDGGDGGPRGYGAPDDRREGGGPGNPGEAPPPPPGYAGGGAGGPPPRPLGPLMAGAWFETADADRDGRVTLAEARTAAAAAFDRLDADHDGVISPDERAAAGGFGRGGPRGGQGDSRGGGYDAPPPR